MVFEQKMMYLPEKPNMERWAEMPFIVQMANIGSEVGRTFKWKRKGNENMAKGAFVRALDLFDLTIAVGRISEPFSLRGSMLKEVIRARDQFCEEYLSEDNDALLLSDKYFSHFAKACALRSLPMN